jgi:hypothetical protein
MQLDEFCAQAGLWPNAIKIDVDGGEGRVIEGARRTLSRPGLRSLIVEAGDGGLQSAARRVLQEAGLRRVETVQRSKAGNEVWVR